MKKILLASLLTVLTLLSLMLISAKKSGASWYYNGGHYQSLPEAGWVNVSSLYYSQVIEGTYINTGESWVTRSGNPELTHIHGNCTHKYDAPDFEGILLVDGYGATIFDTDLEAGSFTHTEVGSEFVLKIYSEIPVKCNVTLEVVR